MYLVIEPKKLSKHLLMDIKAASLISSAPIRFIASKQSQAVIINDYDLILGISIVIPSHVMEDGAIKLSWGFINRYVLRKPYGEVRLFMNIDSDFLNITHEYVRKDVRNRVNIGFHVENIQAFPAEELPKSTKNGEEIGSNESKHISTNLTYANKKNIQDHENELLSKTLTSNSLNKLKEIVINRHEIEAKLDFNPENLADARERIIRSIVQRQGQSKFRSELLKAYGGQCAITDCDAEAALEAAHIFPYRGNDTNHVKNGLLLRADIHTLFDLYLISIDPDTSKVVVSYSLLDTCYKELNGKPLKFPKDDARPSLEALVRHYETFLLKQNK